MDGLVNWVCLDLGKNKKLCFELNFLYFLCLFPKKITRFLDLLKIGLVASRAVHGLGRVGFRLSLDPTRRCWVDGGGTRNRPPTSIGRVSFGFG